MCHVRCCFAGSFNSSRPLSILLIFAIVLIPNDHNDATFALMRVVGACREFGENRRTFVGVQLYEFLRRAAGRKVHKERVGFFDSVVPFTRNPQSVVTSGDLLRGVADELAYGRTHIKDASRCIDFTENVDSGIRDCAVAPLALF